MKKIEAKRKPWRKPLPDHKLIAEGPHCKLWKDATTPFYWFETWRNNRTMNGRRAVSPFEAVVLCEMMPTKRDVGHRFDGFDRTIPTPGFDPNGDMDRTLERRRDIGRHEAVTAERHRLARLIRRYGEEEDAERLGIVVTPSNARRRERPGERGGDDGGDGGG